MADVQFYESDNEARLRDRGIIITLTMRHPKKLTRRTVRAALRRFGYRLGNWQEAEWGCAAKAKRMQP